MSTTTTKTNKGALQLRGILGPISGSTSNIVVQKNNVIRIKSEVKKKTG
ncbi:MAG: hypothetical protein RLZZ574_154 [Cyanobacteriota bacterium]